MQIKIFSKEELGFESKVNEFLKQIHETPTMSLIDLRTLDSYIAIVYDLRDHEKTWWSTSSVLYVELQKNIYVYLKAIQCPERIQFSSIWPHLSAMACNRMLHVLILPIETTMLEKNWQ